MSNAPDYWTCKGYKEEPHPEIEVEGDQNCYLCGRSRNSPDTKRRPLPLAGIAAATVAIAAALGTITYVASRPPNCPEGQRKVDGICQAITSTPLYVPRWEPERFSRGERTLFKGKGNTSRDRGIEAFRQGRYSDAVKLFKKAVDGDRNDPEVLIYYNNARARDNGGTPVTLAAVVPVEHKQTSAEEMLRGVAQAQERFNSSQGPNDRLLEIAIANDGNEQDKATLVAPELVNDRSILGVIGHNASSASKAGLEVYEKNGLAMISPTSTSTSLTGDVFFRTVPSDAAAGKKLADYCFGNLRLNEVVVFFNPGSTYSKSLKEAFEDRFVNLGGKVVRDIELNDLDLNAEGEVLRSIYQDGVAAAMLFPNAGTTSVAMEVVRGNSNNLPESQRLQLLGGDALYNPKTLTSGGNAVEGLILAVPWFGGTPEAKDFSQAAEKRWGGRVSWRTAASYDATQAFIEALSASGNPDRSSVLQNLKSVELSQEQTSGDTLQFSREGDRIGQPVLVEARQGSCGGDSQFCFQLVEE